MSSVVATIPFCAQRRVETTTGGSRRTGLACFRNRLQKATSSISGMRGKPPMRWNSTRETQMA